MWATCNVGADKPEDDGLLFQFGRTDGYKYGDKSNKFLTTQENKESNGSIYINTTTTCTKYRRNDKLKLEDDAAHVNMGGKWKMPTKADLEELYTNTTKHVVTINGKKGMLFTSKLNGKSIFVVFAGYWGYRTGQFCNSGTYGYLWSSEVNSSDSGYSWYLHFNSKGYCSNGSGGRSRGYSVRGVFKK